MRKCLYFFLSTIVLLHKAGKERATNIEAHMDVSMMVNT